MSDTCGRCQGEIELRSVGDNYLTGKPIMRWRRVDRPKIGCPENPVHYCYPVTKEIPYHARIL